VAFRDTGLAWGLMLFLAILLCGGIIRCGLQWFQLLHTPKLAILMTATVTFIMAAILLGVATGQVLPTRASTFPLMILTLTVERFAIIWEEEGLGKAAKVVVGTVFVIAGAFVVMNWQSLQIIVVTFPETLLLVVAAFVIVGRWTGMRFGEYMRFRELIFRKER
jgi:phosphoglycerol transferase MdoB-like AlkP superfamily enzyme